MEATLERAVSPSLATPRAALWTGRVLSGIPTLFMLFDAAVKFSGASFVAEASARIGWPDHLNPVLGVVVLACVALYLVKRTSVLGAVLLTGYLGGAVAIHARIGDPLAGFTLFPVYVGVLFWVGLVLRDARVRALIFNR
jgi:hypothetical protein